MRGLHVGCKGMRIKFFIKEQKCRKMSEGRDVFIELRSRQGCNLFPHLSLVKTTKIITFPVIYKKNVKLYHGCVQLHFHSVLFLSFFYPSFSVFLCDDWFFLPLKLLLRWLRTQGPVYTTCLKSGDFVAPLEGQCIIFCTTCPLHIGGEQVQSRTGC